MFNFYSNMYLTINIVMNIFFIYKNYNKCLQKFLDKIDFFLNDNDRLGRILNVNRPHEILEPYVQPLCSKL